MEVYEIELTFKEPMMARRSNGNVPQSSDWRCEVKV